MSASPLRLAFTGYYGMSNFGDDLFGVVCMQAAKRYWPATRPRLVSPAGAIGSGGIGVAGKALRLMRAAEAVLRNDIIVLGGGSIIASGSSRARKVQFALGRHLGTDFGAVGVSVGPFGSESDAAAAAAVLRRLKFLTVRDHSSFEAARSMDLGYDPIMGGDLAALYQPDPATAAKPSDVGVIGFAPCNYAVPGDRDSQRRVLDVHKQLATAVAASAKRRQMTVRLLSLNAHPVLGDDELVRMASAIMASAGVQAEVVRAADAGVAGTWRAIANSTAIVSARLHGAIPAYLSGVPFCLYEYHPKCSAFLDDIGQSDALRLAPSASVEKMSAAIEQVVAGEPVPSLRRDDYKRRATAAFRRAPWGNPD